MIDPMWPFCPIVPAWRTKTRFAPMMSAMQERDAARLAARLERATVRTFVIRKPCRGRVALRCAHGVGCEGHSVRVLVKVQP